MVTVAATPSVTTADLKQNPAAVLRKVLEHGPHRITAHGKPTGAVIAPEVPLKKDALNGAELMDLAARTPLTDEQARSWLRDIESAYIEDDFI